MFKSVTVDSIFPKLWKCKCIPKLKVFAWLLLMDRLNTRDMIIRRHWHLNSGPNCVLCNQDTLETRDHLFIDCPFAKKCWDFCTITWSSGASMSDIFMTAKRNFQGPNFLEITICAAWNIWKERNGFIFEERRPSFSAWKARFLGDLQTTSYRLKKSKVQSIKTWFSSLV